ncbi:MAG: patatin-like phospholipase family protein, partial [Kiritimatiellae bacterium]|nr:patatin-like phospholipase family protein [Kiritimatiellia bacterium]
MVAQSAATKRDIGLVLSGGGAKGAYQAGVWKALVESGVANRIAAISGTSVGAINAAAFAAVWNPDRIRDVWHHHVASVVSPNLKALSPLMVLEAIGLLTDGKAFPLHGLLDRDKVAGVLSKALPQTWSAGIPAIYATSLEILGGAFDELSCGSYRIVRFRIDEERDPGRRRSEILASCAIPWCYSPVEIDGKRHVDGGWDAMGGENVPLTPILECHPEIKTIVVIRCNSADIEPEPLRIPRGTDLPIVEIRPREPLPGIFDLDNLGGGLLSGSLFSGIPS